MLRLKVGFLLAAFAIVPIAAKANSCPESYAALARAPVHQRGEALVSATYGRLEELKAGRLPGIEIEVIGTSDGFPIQLVRVRSPNPKAARVFVSSGVHGDEPEGVTTGMALLENTIRSRRYDLTYVPMMNPGGLKAETRANLAKLDINRSFDPGVGTEAAEALKKAMRGRNFEVAVDLHGASQKTQFFLISAKEEGARADEILKNVPEALLLPSSTGTYPGYAPGLNDPKKYRMLFPGSAISNNGGTLKDFLAAYAPRSYTLEYPGAVDFSLQQEWNYRILNSILETAEK
jgi:hypothetical protein